MIDKIEYKGIWHIPENPENEVEGTLFFNPDGDAILDLIGAFTDFPSSIQNQKIILGFTTKGKKITLLDCFENSRSMSFPGINTTSYLVSFIFEGAHFASVEEIKFNRINANLSRLEEWVNIWGFDINFDTKVKSIKMNYNIPDSIHFKINDSISGYFNFYFKSPMVPAPIFKIEQITDVELFSENDVDFHDLLELLFHFRLFLTLGVFEDTFIKEIEFSSNALTFHPKEDVTYKEKVKLFFVQNSRNTKVLTRGSHDFLFNFLQIRANFEPILQKFFTLKETIHPVIDTIFATFSEKDEYSENRFLNIVQALELYHRSIIEDTDILKKDFQSILDPILTKLSDQQTKWLREKLAYKYEPNLRTRLKFLFRKFPINPLNRIIQSNDLTKIIDATVNTRNYYTHYDESLKPKAYKNDKLFYLTEKLKFLLIIIVLSETGFTNKEIEDLFSRHEYRFFNHLIGKSE